MTGYTAKQSERLMERLDSQAAKACVNIAAMFDLVTDHNPHRKSYLQDQVISAASEVKEIVRRRTR